MLRTPAQRIVLSIRENGAAQQIVPGKKSEDGAMTDGKARTPAFQVNSGLMITGAVLAGLGSLLGLAGLTISVAALASAARRWTSQQPVPPSELARQQWARARAATAAGAQAWRDGTAAQEVSGLG